MLDGIGRVDQGVVVRVGAGEGNCEPEASTAVDEYQNVSNSPAIIKLIMAALFAWRSTRYFALRHRIEAPRDSSVVH
jgi:hypothetical protein